MRGTPLLEVLDRFRRILHGSVGDMGFKFSDLAVEPSEINGLRVQGSGIPGVQVSVGAGL